jgi:hypothetical protein
MALWTGCVDLPNGADVSAEPAPVEALHLYVREKRVLLTAAQERQLADFLRKLEVATGGVRITASDLSRALLILVFQAENEVLQSAAAACSQLKRHPATADLGGKDRLEGQLASIVFDALASAASRRAQSAGPCDDTAT